MATDLTSELFNAVTQVARAEALPALRARAEREGLIISNCGWCGAYLGEQDGRGVTGISTGICAGCLKAQSISPVICEACLAGYHEEIATAVCDCRCHPSRNGQVAEPLRSIINGMLP